MDYINKLKVILEAPEDDIDLGADEPSDDVQMDEPDAPPADGSGGEIEKTEAEELIDTEKGLTDWTGIPDPIPGKTLKELKGVKRPLENGWNQEQIISALKPTIMFFAKKYATPTFSIEEAIAEQMTGVLTALKNDKGIAPFTSHVFRYLSTSAQRGAGKASNVSGVPQTKGGKYDYLAASRAAVSADAPMPGDEEATYSSQIQSHYDKAGQSAANQKHMTQLIAHLLNAPSVGLSEKEKLILMKTYGIGPDGATGEPRTSKDIADALGVSVVRVSQIRTGAVQKIQDYIKARKFDNPDSAMQSLGLEESVFVSLVKSFLTVINEAIKIEYEMYSKNQIVEFKTNFRGATESVKVHVNSDTFEVESVVNEENESLLGYIDQSSVNEAVEIAKAKVTPKYFSEMVGNIISMQHQPVLATINNNLSSSQIKFMYKNQNNVEAAMGNAEKKAFGKRIVEGATYYGGGQSSTVCWWYPANCAEQVEKMREIMNQKGFGSLMVESHTYSDADAFHMDAPGEDRNVPGTPEYNDKWLKIGQSWIGKMVTVVDGKLSGLRGTLEDVKEINTTYGSGTQISATLRVDGDVKSEPVTMASLRLAESIIREGFDGLKSGSYKVEVNAPYKDGSGNTTYRVFFDIYGEFLEETAIYRIDDVDTGSMDISFDDVNIEMIERLINEKIKNGEIEPIRSRMIDNNSLHEGKGPQHGAGDSSFEPPKFKLTKLPDGRVIDQYKNEYELDGETGLYKRKLTADERAWAAHKEKIDAQLKGVPKIQSSEKPQPKPIIIPPQ